MKFSAKKPRAVLLAAVLPAVVALLLLPNIRTYAQSETEAASARAIPSLTARATESGVLLTWEAAPGAVRYELLTWWAGDPGWQPIGGDNLSGTSHTHADVTAGRTYHYSIRAIYADGAGPWLSSDYPTAVARIATRSGTATPTPTVTLAPGSGATATPPSARTATPTATASSSAELAVPSLTAQATDAGIALRWGAVAGAVRYELLTWWARDPGWQDIGGGSLTGTTYTHTDVVAGRTYHYSIRALDAAGEGSAWLTGDYPTAVARIATRSGTATPTPTVTLAPGSGATATPTATASSSAELAVPSLTAQATDAGIALRWGAVAGAVRYELWTYWARDPGWQDIGGANLTGTSHTHADVTAGTTYYYSIRALNAAGEASPWITADYPSATALATGTPTITPTPATTERGALIALYHATNGDGWTLNDNWLTDKPLDDWYGVDTDKNGRVTTLRLYGNELTGPIPDLTALANLEELGLGFNQLTGPIPDLGNLANLRSLYLRNNLLTGPIPDLGNLANLQWLIISDNRLSGNVPDLGALANLTRLELQKNQLTGPIPDLGALTNLKTLSLGLNRLDGPIPDLTALVNLEELGLRFNQLTGPIPDLGALANLTRLELQKNQLTGPIPDLTALVNLRSLGLSSNELTGPIPDFGNLANLRTISFGHNLLSGPIPDLGNLVNLEYLALTRNKLSGQIPDLSNLANLEFLSLSENDLTGPVPDFSVLTRLEWLDLSENDLTGPVPDFSALTLLKFLFLNGNRFCLPPGASLSHPHSDVDAHLQSLNPAPCTAADLAALPTAPRNLTATVGAARVELRWEAVSDAASYDLWVWDSLDRQWGAVGGVVTSTTYTHPVLTDGRNYYFQVRARNAGGVPGPWSNRAQAVVVPQRFPPPPPSLRLHFFYQKYLSVNGVVIVAPSEVSDEDMELAGKIVAGMLSDNPGLLENLSPKYIRIAIYNYRDAVGGSRSQLPEFSGETADIAGSAGPIPGGWLATAPAGDQNHCYVFIHEFAHTIQSALEYKPGGREFRPRLRALYDAALNKGLWHHTYAAWSVFEYWAETVTFWFHEFMRQPEELAGTKLEDYDPEIARLIAEVFGEGAYAPAECKP